LALAVVGTAGLVWFVLARSDDSSANSSSTTVVAPGTTAPAVTATTAASTAVPTTPAATTIAETTNVAPAPPPAPAFTPPPIPATAVFVGPGVSYALSDPLPSGLPFAEVQSSLIISQLMANFLAAHQWENAQLSLYFVVDGETKHVAVDVLQALWGTADRVSLLLLDAHKDQEGAGYDLLVSSIVNLNDGTTTVQCNHLYVESAPPAVVDLDNSSVISQGESAFMPEELLNDPARVADLRARCV
jgi:hypothetical protein